MYSPWPHQITGHAETTAALEAGERRVCVTSPTGGGKTRLMFDLIRWAKERSWAVSLYTNRRLLFDQTAGGMEAAGLDFGRRAAGHDPALLRDVQLSSIQTEHSRVYVHKTWELHRSRLVIVDEAHVNKGPTAQKITQDHLDGDAYAVVGYTATPVDLGGVYDKLIVAGTNSELRACGALVPALTYAPDEPDMRKFEAKKQPNGEFSEEIVRKAMPPRLLFGRVLEWFRKLNPDLRPSILFAPGVPESLWFAMQLCEEGILSAHIDGQDVWVDGETYPSNPDIRAEVLRRHEAGDIVCLCNRFVLREGIDLPWLYHAVLATVFGSVVTYLQSCGRLLRAHPSLDHVALQDHGGNFWRHGSPNVDREWELGDTARSVYNQRADRIREGHEPSPIVCPNCKKVRLTDPARDNRECPFCGHRARKLVRMVMQTDGTLKEMSCTVFRPRRRQDTPTIRKDWESMYFRARRSRNKMTFRAAEALFAKEHNWTYPPRDLPRMPTEAVDWDRRVCDVPVESLM